MEFRQLSAVHKQFLAPYIAPSRLCTFHQFIVEHHFNLFLALQASAYLCHLHECPSDEWLIQDGQRWNDGFGLDGEISNGCFEELPHPLSQLVLSSKLAIEGEGSSSSRLDVLSG